MKKILIFFLLVTFSSTYAQISLENYYSTGGSNNNYLRLVKLSSSGYKYVTTSHSQISLYNLNHSLFKTITIPALSGGINGNAFLINFISEELFNTNPSDIEYFLAYYDLSNIQHCIVFDELGNVLVSKDTTAQWVTSQNGNEEFISFTPSGAKMIIWQDGNKGAFVYSLPGTLPCHDCTNGTTTSIVANNLGPNTDKLTNYPNPTEGQTTIEYKLPLGSTTADLVFYNVTGQEVKRFKVTNAFHDIIISTADLDAGTYYYQLQTSEGFKAGKKMVVLK